MVKQAEQQQALQKQLWAMANDLRGNMDAASFKDYILGLIFFRYLSENLTYIAEEKYLKEDELTYAEAWADEEIRDALKEELLKNSELGYFIEPEYLYSSLVGKIKEGRFDISMLDRAVKHLEESTVGQASHDDFEGLFDDMVLDSSKLGRGEAERSKLISKIILKVNDIDFKLHDSDIDILGDAYEYLIGQFAANAGKKAGEFYTPQAVSEIMARIVTLGKTKLRDVYDPTCGS